jgi:hypothetical protein
VGVEAEAAGRLSLGGDGSVHRTGYGAMQLPGLSIAVAPPHDHAETLRLLRRAVSWAPASVFGLLCKLGATTTPPSRIDAAIAARSPPDLPHRRGCRC